MPKKQAAKDSNVIDTTKTRTRINSNVEFEERGYRRGLLEGPGEGQQAERQAFRRSSLNIGSALWRWL